MDRHHGNGLAIVKFFESNPEVINVHHPGLLCHPGYELFKKQSNGYNGLVSFQMKGTVNKAKKMYSKFTRFYFMWESGLI